MLFNSAEFFCFFVVVTTVYFLLPQRVRWIFLLASSCYFYMQFKAIYILILFFTIAIDYTAGILIENAAPEHRKKMLVMSIVANVGVLAFFKYANFISENIAWLSYHFGSHHMPPALNILLPIGLSFHTFQSMSYTIEVYRGRQKAERNIGMLAVYVMFYPQLVAGPIERPQNLLHQFRENHYFDGQRVADGLKLMCWGLFKKVVIADRVSLVVNNVYNSPQRFDGFELVLATILFAYQIYCDFSGYSDIAVGAARVMGFTLMENFRFPYAAHSMSDFWRRWHRSLSTWFKDYVYIPLGGNQHGALIWQRNIFITFLLSGLWHGANWTFVCWGALHAVYFLIEKLIWGEPKNSAWNVLYVIGLTWFAWIFFRANTLSDALYIATHLLSSFNVAGLRRLLTFMSTGELGLFVKGWSCAALGILFLEGVQYRQRHSQLSFVDWVNTHHAWLRWGFYYVLVLSIVFTGVFDESRFIYFQF